MLPVQHIVHQKPYKNYVPTLQGNYSTGERGLKAGLPTENIDPTLHWAGTSDLLQGETASYCTEPLKEG